MCGVCHSREYGWCGGFLREQRNVHSRQSQTQCSHTDHLHGGYSKVVVAGDSCELDSNKRESRTERASSSTSQLKHIHTVAHAAGTPRIWDPSLAVCTLHAPGSRHRGAVPTCSSRTPQSAPQSAPLALQTPGLNAPASRCTLRRQETAPDRSQGVACMIPAPRAVPQLAGKCRQVKTQVPDTGVRSHGSRTAHAAPSTDAAQTRPHVAPPAAPRR